MLHSNRSHPPTGHQRFVASLFAALFLVAGCGGGGSDSNLSSAPPPNQPPVASFDATPDNGPAPLLVSFDASNSTDADGTLTTISWDFGDGASDSGVTTTHSYLTAGTFTAVVQITDNNGASATTSQQISVLASAPQSLNLSGQIQILASSAVDADVNDTLSTPNVSNNTASNAQPIPLPVSLGGFANVPGSGPASGRLFTSGDTSDFYAISGAGGERVVLDVGNHPNADLDLRLWGSDNALVDASVGFNTIEVVTLPAAGDYFLEVVAVADASTYVLSAGQTVATTAQIATRTATRLSDDFVAGEWLTAATTAQAPGASRLLTVVTEPEYRAQRMASDGHIERHQLIDSAAAAAKLTRTMVATLERATFRTTSKAIAALPTAQQPPSRSLPPPSISTDLALKYATLLQIGELRRSGVDNSEPNLWRAPHEVPNDSLYSAQWHFDAISLPLAWGLTMGSSDVIVAVVDTGVLINHPDFAGQLSAGYDFISDAARAGDGDGIDPNPNDPGDATLAGNSSFHGTHVAGTAGAATDNGTGVAGSGWNTRIMPLRVLGSEGGTSFDILQAVRFAAGLSNSSNTLPAIRADIINLSLGGGLFSQAEQDTFTAARAAGVLLFASAGNESTDNPSFPAAYNGVVSVSATTISNTLASYSNFGPDIDLAAPGGNSSTDINGDGIADGVMSTLGDDSGGSVSFGFGVLNGTSMAAPHVAGVAALMLAVHPELTPAEFDTALLSGELTQDLGPPGRDDQFGVGLLNAQKAVLTALALANGTSIDPGPILTSSANRLNFGTFQNEFTVTLANAGSGELLIDTPISDQPWLTATTSSQTSLAAGSTGSYALSVNRDTLPNGTYSGRITFTSNSTTSFVDVVMQVSAIDLAANAGTHFFILIDELGETVNQSFVNTPTDGIYSFSLTDVSPGNYRLFAGTDLDNDDFLCDAGEACGAFRTLDAPEVFTVTDDRTDLNFLTGFRQNFSTSSASDEQTTTDGPAAAVANGFRIDKSLLQSQQSLVDSKPDDTDL